MATPVRLDDHPGGVRVLTLDRPPANALDDELLGALEAAVDDTASDPDIRALVVRAEGAFFCGGFDLRAPRRTGEAVEVMVRRYRDSHRKLLALTKPTVAVVQGHAVAGGLVLALACDHRVAADADYKVGLNETAIGAAFPPVAMEIVRLRLDHGTSVELILGAEVHGSDALVRWGVVPRLTAPAALDRTAFELAERLARHPREVYAHAKSMLVSRAVERVARVTLDEELAVAALWSTDESRAARATQRRRLTS
jgi:enoyl-CoA hydratase